MHFLSTIALFALPAAVFGATQVVQVGAGGALVYDPMNITAAVGDVIQFQFTNKNHTVTQNSFGDPCTPMTGGVNSGFLFVPPNTTFASSSDMPTWSITINSTDAPLWFHCSQTNPVSHCQSGMVFSVNANPNSNKSFADYLAIAKASNSTPSTALAAPNAAANAPSPIASEAASEQSTSTKPSGNGAPAGIARGAAGLLTIAGIGAMLM